MPSKFEGVKCRKYEAYLCWIRHAEINYTFVPGLYWATICEQFGAKLITESDDLESEENLLLKVYEHLRIAGDTLDILILKYPDTQPLLAEVIDQTFRAKGTLKGLGLKDLSLTKAGKRIIHLDRKKP